MVALTQTIWMIASGGNHRGPALLDKAVAVGFAMAANAQYAHSNPTIDGDLDYFTRAYNVLCHMYTL